jgi:penicillin-binding protein 1A
MLRLKSPGSRWLILIAGLIAAGTMAAISAVIGAYYYVAPGLPAADTIRQIPLQIPLRIFSRDGRLVEEVGERRRVLVTYDDLPQFVVDAFVAAEDRRFFEHPGVDYQGILRAGLNFLVSGSLSQGGSTITQQLARDYFLTRERLFTRKLREAFLAYKIEQAFTKQEIMALFVNKMFFGQRAYGVAAAAQVYFGKPLSEINVAEAATLAGVLPAPSEKNPVRSPANALQRRTYVLGRMNELDFIDDAAYEEAMAYPLVSKLHGTANELTAPYVAEMVRREMLIRYGDATYAAGYRVMTTVDSRMQEGANYALRNGLLEFSRRRGYRGPIASLEIDPKLLQSSYEEWPEDLRISLQDYGNPGGLSVAVVTAVQDDNSASIVLQNGISAALPWRGISWAKPYIDSETSGAAPDSVQDVLKVADVIYVMPVKGGGWALAQIPQAQGAVVSVDPLDGAITSLAGGFDFSISKFNRATQAARQPGSSFKPFIYSAALEQGNTPATIILDAPVVINSSELEAVWRPVNYSGRFYGEQRLRQALVHSMNLASVRLLLNNTGIGNAVRHLAPFGFSDAALPRNGSLALGGGETSPLDMAQAYATFANGGYAIKPYVIDTIMGPDDEVLYRADPAIVCPTCESEEDPGSHHAQRPDGETDDTMSPARQRRSDSPYTLSMEQMAEVALSYRPDAAAAPELFANVNLAPRVISAQNAYLIADMMRDVIVSGTGRRAMVLGRRDLSGKTGTSNDRRDAWFGGFNADLSAVVYVGYDNFEPLGPREEGSRTALPVWIEFIRVALRGAPEHALAMPEGIVSVKISKSTGCPATASDPAADTMFEKFMADNVPQCEIVETQTDPFNSDEFDAEEPAAEEDDEDEEDDSLF